jgi:hypothetical protein
MICNHKHTSKNEVEERCIDCGAKAPVTSSMKNIEYDIWHHSVSLVAGANMACQDELASDIFYLEKMAGTGYYNDPDGAKLLIQIVEYLRTKIERK